MAEALREEYLAIVDAGFLLQVDDPWLIEYLSENPATTPEQRRRDAEQHIEVLNHALRGIPAEKIRLHTCYGLNHGPRVHDLAFRDIAPLMLKINAGAYSFEVANPRHQHEWKIWRDVPLPDGKVLIPGLLGHASNYVEHPELIADTIELTPASSAARTSSPGPTAGSPPGPRSSPRCTRPSSGRSSGRWRRARGWPRGDYGEPVRREPGPSAAPGPSP